MKLVLAFGLIGWLTAALIWYAGRQVSRDSDTLVDQNSMMSVQLQECYNDQSRVERRVQFCKDSLFDSL